MDSSRPISPNGKFMPKRCSSPSNWRSGARLWPLFVPFPAASCRRKTSHRGGFTNPCGAPWTPPVPSTKSSLPCCSWSPSGSGRSLESWHSGSTPPASWRSCSQRPSKPSTRAPWKASAPRAPRGWKKSYSASFHKYCRSGFPSPFTGSNRMFALRQCSALSAPAGSA